MSILVVAENSNSELKSSTSNTITAASNINDDIHVVVIGNQCEEIAKKVALFEKVKKVLLLVDINYEKLLTEIDKCMKELNYNYTFTSEFGSNKYGSNILKRIDIWNFDNKKQFILKLKGQWDWLSYYK